MTRNTRHGMGVGLALLVMAMPAIAHHSFAMFDQTKEISLTGTVSEFYWINPHTHLILNVEAGPGVDPKMVGEWDVEGASPGIMSVQGWSSTLVKPGEKITVVANPLRNGQKGATLFYITLADSKRLYNDVARPKESSAR
ncbi:MAG: DUF6152 family protein [Steroidobacteraceae bacterium]